MLSLVMREIISKFNVRIPVSSGIQICSPCLGETERPSLLLSDYFKMSSQILKHLNCIDPFLIDRALDYEFLKLKKRLGSCVPDFVTCLLDNILVAPLDEVSGERIPAKYFVDACVDQTQTHRA